MACSPEVLCNAGSACLKLSFAPCRRVLVRTTHCKWQLCVYAHMPQGVPAHLVLTIYTQRRSQEGLRCQRQEKMPTTLHCAFGTKYQERSTEADQVLNFTSTLTMLGGVHFTEMLSAASETKCLLLPRCPYLPSTMMMQG